MSIKSQYLWWTEKQMFKGRQITKGDPSRIIHQVNCQVPWEVKVLHQVCIFSPTTSRYSPKLGVAQANNISRSGRWRSPAVLSAACVPTPQPLPNASTLCLIMACQHRLKHAELQVNKWLWGGFVGENNRDMTLTSPRMSSRKDNLHSHVQPNSTHRHQFTFL